MTKPELKPDVRRAVISETSFPNSASLDDIRRTLKSMHATGKLVVHMSEGGTSRVIFEARHPLNGDDHVELLFVPGSPV
jgi:hypothetical protein